MKEYIDSKIFANPLYEYVKWITTKIIYQIRYWGSHLRIDYNAFVRDVKFGKKNYIGRNGFLVGCELGDYSYISYNCSITNTKIGKFCSIGPNVIMAPGAHPTSTFVSTHPSTFSRSQLFGDIFTTKTLFTGNTKVNIGNDVWIGANCIILDGVTIKDGAIVAANSVVSKDVSAYNIVGGSPAKFIKKRFDDTEIEKLLSIRWWDKSERWIKDNINSFWDIKAFIANNK